ncbi:MAG: glucose-6-phosphate dehydrogenase [Acidobacteria bacterium]|nr:glucose-6-phosphate dehydrogenase [Acidobacteriota bacterium]
MSMTQTVKTPEPTREPAGPCVMVIFGASGDLTKRKLIPAIYNLAKARLLPKEFAVVGIARNELTTEAFREKMTQDIKQFATDHVDPSLWEWLVQRLYYTCGGFSDPEAYTRLQALLHQVDRDHGTGGNYLYYLATSPSFFSEIIQQLGASGLVREEDGQARRVIIEKPFGRDLDSARALNREIGKTLKERQIYRIDHYLGKETVQNIMVFRFGNSIFEPVWNRRYIDHVQITVAETVGVERRGLYYEEAGTLRDMVPNHIFQLIALTAMEPPISFDADAVRDEKAKVLRAIQPIEPEDVLTRAVRGQYGPGNLTKERVPGYRTEPDVSPQSATETYVALKLQIDNWRWADVPFYLRTGKRMPRRVTEIAIQFRRAPFLLFRKTPVEHLTPNLMVLQIQPEESIKVRFGAKIPGPSVLMGSVDMDFRYADYFGTTPSTGYETLLYDCMNDDATLFHRADTVEVGWSVVTPILDVWKALPPRSFPNYEAGTWGPADADDLLKRDGRQWRLADA